MNSNHADVGESEPRKHGLFCWMERGGWQKHTLGAYSVERGEDVCLILKQNHTFKSNKELTLISKIHAFETSPYSHEKKNKKLTAGAGNFRLNIAEIKPSFEGLMLNSLKMCESVLHYRCNCSPSFLWQSVGFESDGGVTQPTCPKLFLEFVKAVCTCCFSSFKSARPERGGFNSL